jgi:tetratricopeptide (TPR) repeat protein
MARRLGDPTLELGALVSQHWADWRPDNVDERLAAARAIVRLGAQVGHRELAILGQAFLLADVLEVGDLAAADSALESFARLAEELRQPRYLWVLTMFRAMRALLAGRFAEGEQLAAEALAIGQRTQASDTAQAVGVLLIIIRRECGGLEELVAASTGLAEQYRAVRTWQYATAFLEAEVGQEESARRRFDALATHGFTDVVRDLTWLITTVVAAETAALLVDRTRAATLYDLLLPYADHCVVIGYGLACWGSVSRYLGLLATTLGRWADAERHFTTALEVHERLGARAWVARTQYDLARLLMARAAPGDREEARGLVARVLATAHELGMGRLADGVRQLEAALTADGPGAAVPAPSTRDAQPREPFPENMFHLEGDFWTVRYAGTRSRLKDAKGFHYIAQLLRHPGQEFHVADLLAVITPEARDAAEPARPAALGHAGEVLDPQARAAYQRRIEELRAELDQATDWGDQGRVAHLREEIEALTRELANAYGLGGRARKAADSAERIRKAVTGRVRDSIARLQKESPALALHLTNAVRLGTFCAYTPDKPTPWTF